MNPRPTGPKPVALPNCATPRYKILWQGQKDSNPRHVVLETTALPTELYPYVWRRRWDSNPCGPKMNPNGLANRPLQPLEYFSSLPMAERVGFEPTAPCGVTGFQDQLLKPLGHLSMSDTCKNRRGVFIGDPSEIRTPDTLIKSQVLCRLS